MKTPTTPLSFLRLAPGLLGLVAACSSPPEPAPAASHSTGIVLATVDGVDLSLQEALDAFVTSHLGHSILVRGEGAVRELAGRIAERRLFLAEAETLGLTQDPDLRQLVDEQRLEFAKQRFWKDEVADQAQVSEEEIEAFYEKTAMALDLGLIEVAERAQAEELRAQVLAGADLAQLADEFSLHPSRAFGGTLALVQRGQLQPDLEAAAFVLEQPGDVSPLVPSERGFVFVRLDQRVENTSRPGPEVMLPQIRKALEAKRKDERRSEVTQRLIEQVGATTHPEILTRERILAQDDGQEPVATAGDVTLTVEGVRTILDLDLTERSEPEVVAKAMEHLVDDWVLDQALRQEVAARGLLDEPAIEAQTRKFEQETVFRWLVERYVYDGIEPNEEDLRRYYEEHLSERYSRQPEVHMAYLVLESETKAQEALQRLRAGEEFGAVAREVSLDERSSVHGGRIGWVQANALLPQVEEALLHAPADSLQGPIETEVGWFVVHVLELREGSAFPFVQARHVVLRDLIKQRQQERLADWKRRLAERADVQIHEEGVQAAVAWLEVEAAGQEPEAPETPSSHGRPGLPQASTKASVPAAPRQPPADQGDLR